MKITFLGAAGTVTGSKYLFEAAGRGILIDFSFDGACKQCRPRNRATLPIVPEYRDVVEMP